MSFEREQSSDSDVVVIGGGLAGLATSIHLSKAGLKVVCLEPVEQRDRIVGESLDWSGPELVKQLGLEMGQLVDAGIATYKRHVSLQLHDGSATEYIPSQWLSAWPFNIELRTLHVNRLRLDAEIGRIAAECGVIETRDRAVALEWSGKGIAAISGASGKRYNARWFVDASGYASSFLGRQLSLPSIEYGPKKVGIWSYFKIPGWKEGTTLYADCSPETYLKWIWEIPISPDETSVGMVTSGTLFQEQRSIGAPADAVFRSQLESVERFRRVLEGCELEAPKTTSFSCRVFRTLCGPNWFIVGEAAAVPDPITGNGVTSALRHADEVARLILRNNQSGRVSRVARNMYTLRALQMCCFFDSLVEKLAYAWPLRDRFGLRRTGDIYTSVAWTMNHLYSRFKPRGVLATILFCTALAGFRAMTSLAHQLCLLLPSKRRSPILTHKAGLPLG